MLSGHGDDAGRRNTADESYGLYVLVDDCAGNALNGGQAAYNAFRRGEGMTLDELESSVATLPCG